MTDQTNPASPRALYERIGDFLFANGLDPSPSHFSLGHRYFTGEDPAFNRLIDDTIELVGGLSPVAAAAIVAERSVEISASGLSRIASEAEAKLETVADRLLGAENQVSVYGDALKSSSERIAGGADPQALLPTLMALTTTMIASTREVEKHLRRTGDDMRGMRASLADAQVTAHRDPLTGLPNRRALDARLLTALDTARRTGAPLSVAICDIDHFKAFNDSFGHQIGDEVIKFVGASLAQADVGRIFTARYGGEEFVVLFEGLTIAEAERAVEQTRAALASRELKVTATGQSLGRLSFSAGLAQFVAGDGPYAMLKRADTALYAAKKAGRNRVECG